MPNFPSLRSTLNLRRHCNYGPWSFWYGFQIVEQYSDVGHTLERYAALFTSSPFRHQTDSVLLIRQKKYIYVCFRIPDPTSIFAPTLNILLWIVSKLLSNLLKNGEQCIEKCNFFIKYFDEIKCYADRPYLVFSELKPETHIYFVLVLQFRSFGGDLQATRTRDPYANLWNLKVFNIAEEYI